jgi:hypothetical protein
MFSNPSIAQLFAFATRDATVPLGVLQAIAYASGRLQVETVPYFKTIMGLQIVGIVGGSLRAWCYRTLHKYFTFNLSVQEEQKVCTVCGMMVGKDTSGPLFVSPPTTRSSRQDHTSGWLTLPICESIEST